MGEHGTGTWRNADCLGKGLYTMPSLHGEITRGVGGLERTQVGTIMGRRRGEERWKAKTKPSEKEQEHKLFFNQNKFLAPELTTTPSLLLSPHISLQVTLSYGVFENKLNVIELGGPFSPQEDPSRYGA